MTTRAKLASLGVTMTQAHDFIMANLGSPATIYEVAVQNKISSQMLADIVSINFPGLSAGDVEAFFAAQGISASGLQGFSYGNNSNVQFLPPQFSHLSQLVGPNERTGELSNESIRAKVVEVTGLETYKFTFAPFNFKGNEDGVFTAQDLGVAGLANVKATWQNMESLWFGTVLNMLDAIDVSEVETIEAYINDHEALLAAEDSATLASLLSQVITMFDTPSENHYVTNEEMLELLVFTNQEVVKLIGTNSEDSLMQAFTSTLLNV